MTGPGAVVLGTAAGFGTSMLIDEGYKQIREPLIDTVTTGGDYAIDVGKTVVEYHQNAFNYATELGQDAREYYNNLCLWNCD